MKKIMFALTIICLSFLSGVNIQAGEIKVYDAEGQYLGELLSFNKDNRGTVEIFIPQLERTASISSMNGDVYNPIRTIRFFYKNDDCTGTPYVDPELSYTIIKFNSKIYTGEKDAPGGFLDVESQQNSAGTCDLISYDVMGKIPAIELDIEDMPFTVPVALPMSFEETKRSHRQHRDKSKGKK